MRKNVRRSLLLGVLLVMLAFSVFAAPDISIKGADYDAGTILEGSEKKVTHTFMIKNTGDEPLRITKVKPG